MDAYRGYGMGLRSMHGEDRGQAANPDARSRTAASTQSSVPRRDPRWGAAGSCCRRLQGGGFVSRKLVVRASLVAGLACVVAGLAGCATPAPTDVGGRWRPVNRFPEAPQAIPLQQAYVYQASPADGTLKTMLGRWAKDARLTLAYLHPNDYTLHAPVAQIRTSSLEEAASALSAAYAEQGVRVMVERPRIVVSQSLPPSAGAAPTAALSD